MKPPPFEVSDKCFVTLIPGNYTGTSSLIDPTQPYLFSGAVTGFRWEAETQLWWVEIYDEIGRFWVRGECVHADQITAFRFLRNKIPDVCDSAVRDEDYRPCVITAHGWSGEMPEYLSGYHPGDVVPAEVWKKARRILSAHVAQKELIPYNASDAAFFGLKNAEVELKNPLGK